MHTYYKPLIFIIIITVLSSCDKTQPVKKTQGSHHGLLIRENSYVFAEDDTENAIEQTLPLPDYLMNRSGFFISATNNRYLSLGIAIKKITLVDFSGNIEEVASFAEAKMIDLAQLHEKELIVFDNSIFASEYERLIIVFDVKNIQSSELVDKDSIKTTDVDNFLDFDLLSSDFIMEVGINKDSGVVLKANEMTQFDIHFDLDTSFKMIHSKESEVAVLRPSVKVNTFNYLPQTFLVKSRGFVINNDVLSINTHQNKQSREYWLENISLPRDAFIAIDGIKEKVSLTAREAISSQFFAHIKTADGNVMTNDALFLFDQASDVYSVFNLVSGDSMFTWTDPSGNTGRDETALQNNKVPIQNTVLLKPEFHKSQKDTLLATGQAAKLIRNKKAGRIQLILWPLSFSARVGDITQEDETNRVALNNLDTFVSDVTDLVQAPVFALMASGNRLPEPGQRIRFDGYLSSKVPWSFALNDFVLLKDDVSTVIFSQSEFDHTPIINQLDLVDNALVLTLKESSKQTTVSGETVTGASKWSIAPSASYLTLTTFNAEGGISKQYSSQKALFDDYNKLRTNGFLTVSVKALIDTKSNTINELDIVFNTAPAFYDLLAYIHKTPLQYLSLSDFQNFDLSYIDFDLTSTNLTRLFVSWSRIIPYKDESKNETLCDVEENEDIDYTYYCAYRRLNKSTRQLIGEFVNQQLFAVPANQYGVRDAYATLMDSLSPADQSMLQYEIITDHGYYPQRYIKNPNIKKAEKVIKNLKKIYKVFGRVFPDLSLKNLVEEVDRRRKKPARLNKRL